MVLATAFSCVDPSFVEEPLDEEELDAAPRSPNKLRSTRSEPIPRGVSNYMMPLCLPRPAGRDREARAAGGDTPLLSCPPFGARPQAGTRPLRTVWQRSRPLRTQRLQVALQLLAAGPSGGVAVPHGALLVLGGPAAAASAARRSIRHNAAGGALLRPPMPAPSCTPSKASLSRSTYARVARAAKN